MSYKSIICKGTVPRTLVKHTIIVAITYSYWLLDISILIPVFTCDHDIMNCSLFQYPSPCAPNLNSRLLWQLLHIGSQIDLILPLLPLLDSSTNIHMYMCSSIKSLIINPRPCDLGRSASLSFSAHSLRDLFSFRKIVTS